MTETRAQLQVQGWSFGFAFAQDMGIVDKMRCNRTDCGERLILETWRKGNRTKQFTRCIRCGHRKPF